MKSTVNPHHRQVSTENGHREARRRGVSSIHQHRLVVSAVSTVTKSRTDRLTQELEQIRDMFVPPWRE